MRLVFSRSASRGIKGQEGIHSDVSVEKTKFLPGTPKFGMEPDSFRGIERDLGIMEKTFVVLHGLPVFDHSAVPPCKKVGLEYFLIVTAVNDAYARRNAVISLLKTNIQETVFDDLEAKIAAIDEQLAKLQQQMIDNSGDNALVEELGLQMDDLRGERQDILAEAAERTDLQTRMNDMIAFLEEMPAAVTEYSEALARRLVERITIFDEKIVVELKSGLQMEVEE